MDKGTDRLTMTAWQQFEIDARAASNSNIATETKCLEIFKAARFYSNDLHCTNGEIAKIRNFASALMDQVFFGLCTEKELAYFFEGKL